MNDLEKIKEIALNNHGLFKTSMIVSAGIRKEHLKTMVEERQIIRLERGIYALSDTLIDRYYEFQMQCPKAIYSYSSAAYINGLLDKPLDYMECTLPRGFNTSHVNTRLKLKYHFVTEEQYNMGLTEHESPFGTLIKVYDRERIVCDYIRHKSRCDIQIWGSVLNSYFRSRNKDLSKLIKYAKKFDIMEDLEMYVELLQ